MFDLVQLWVEKRRLGSLSLREIYMVGTIAAQSKQRFATCVAFSSIVLLLFFFSVLRGIL